MNVKAIAEVCHAANAAYCKTIGDNSQPSWDAAPEWQRESAVKGVFFHLQQLGEGVEPAPSASHNSWLEEKRQDGWSYAPVKNAEKKEHPCFVSYEDLPLSQRRKDYIFGAIVKAIFEADRQEQAEIDKQATVG